MTAILSQTLATVLPVASDVETSAKALTDAMHVIRRAGFGANLPTILSDALSDLNVEMVSEFDARRQACLQIAVRSLRNEIAALGASGEFLMSDGADGDGAVA